MIKAIIRTPTKQFGYVETEVELENYQQLKAEHDLLFDLMNKEQDVSEIEFTTRLVEVINSDLTEWGSADAYQALNSSQMAVFQALKRFRKRLPDYN